MKLGDLPSTMCECGREGGMTPVVQKGFLKQYVKVSVAAGASLKSASQRLSSYSAFPLGGWGLSACLCIFTASSLSCSSCTHRINHV